jgi:hypothetical protein
MADSNTIKQQGVAVCTNSSTSTCQAQQGLSQSITQLQLGLLADKKYDPADPPPLIPAKTVQGFRDSHTLSSSLTVLGVLFILYGSLT